MWITDKVELPQEIVDAHSDGKLVFFIGAGASVDPPSNLPLFGDLAKQLALLARVPYDKNVAVDYFLGSMPATFDVHEQARQLIMRPDSQFNPMHTSIVRIVSSTGSFRVVTTNFDNHLGVAASAASIPVPDLWVGPALPLGDNFLGLVHLHGSINRPPSELVLTDRDFGRAYLTDAWATRFLLKMFDEFVVLFVGYSHEDPIMRYLSLGLPSHTRRFVFTDRPADEKWEHLGLHTIGYPVVRRNHRALLSALQAWDARARMGQLEHRARMRQIIAGGSALTPLDGDYLIARVRTPDGAKEFASLAKTTDWLEWAETLPEFKLLFSGTVVDEAARTLAFWFCDSFISQPSLNGAALQTAQRLGQRFNDEFYQWASFAAIRLSGSDELAAQRWKTILASSIEGETSGPRPGISVIPYSAGSGPEHMSVLRAALRPQLELKRRWFIENEDLVSPPDAEVIWRTNEHAITEQLALAVRDYAAGDATLGGALEESLSSAYELLNGYFGPRTFDALSFSRSAIEPNPQDSYRHPVDSVVDALRDWGVKALPVRRSLADEWWARDLGLFTRLAVHLVGEDATRTADEKVEWLLDHNCLYTLGLKHEVFRILALAGPTLSQRTRERLLNDATVGPTLPIDMADREQHTDYAVFNLLIWLKRVTSDWPELEASISRVRSARPQFAERDHPDFDHWSSSGTWGGHLPMEPEDFAQLAEGDPIAALEVLLSRDYSERDFDAPTWEDAQAVVRRAVEIRPKIGEALWNTLEGRDHVDESQRDLLRAISEGWSKAELGTFGLAATTRVGLLVNDAPSARAVVDFLLGQARLNVESEEDLATEMRRTIAVNLWGDQKDTFTHPANIEGSFLSLNSWPGELTTYWITEIDRQWRQARREEAWVGLTAEVKTAITDLLSGPADTLDAIRPALASEAFFLFVADPTFTSEHVLPLFYIDETANLAWGTFLYHPRFNDAMLAAGLLKALVSEWQRLAGLEAHGLQREFIGFVAAVSSFAALTPADRQPLLDQSVLAADAEYAPAFASETVRLLQLDDVNGSEVWDNWLRNHVAARLNGRPRVASPEELARWADVVPYLGERLPDAITLFSGRRIGLGADYLTPDIPRGLRSDLRDRLIEHLADRISSTTSTGWLTSHEVEDLIQRVADTYGDAAAQSLKDAAISQGSLAP